MSEQKSEALNEGSSQGFSEENGKSLGEKAGQAFKHAAFVFAWALKWLLFHFFWLLPIFLIPRINFNLLDWFHIKLSNPALFLFFGLSLTVQIFLVLQILFPALVLLFVPHMRIRDPKQIIKYGEKFRSFQLTTPEFLVVQIRSWPSFLQGLFGFLALPRPFRAVVLIKQSSQNELLEEEFGFWVHRLTQVARSKAQGRFWFWLIFFGVLCFLSGQNAGELNIWIPASLMALVATFALSENALDQLLILSLEGVPSHYWNMLRKVYGKWMVPKFRSDRYFTFAPSYSKLYWHWAPAVFFAVTFYLLNSKFQLPGSLIFVPVVANDSPKIDLQNEHASSTQVEASSEKNSFQEVKATDSEVVPSSNSFFALIEKNDIAGVKQFLFSRPAEAQNAEHSQNSDKPQDEFDLGKSLFHAIQKSSPEMVYLLVQSGAPLRQQDEHNQNALFYAVQNPNPDRMLDYLLLVSWDFNQKNDSGMNIVEYAQAQGRTELAKKLLGRLQMQTPSAEPSASTAE